MDKELSLITWAVFKKLYWFLFEILTFLTLLVIFSVIILAEIKITFGIVFATLFTTTVLCATIAIIIVVVITDIIEKETRKNDILRKNQETQKEN